MELQTKELTHGFVRYKLAENGWTTFKIMVNYPFEDQRRWKLILGVGLENIDLVYKINVPNEKGELIDQFVLSDGNNFLSKEYVINADMTELMFFLQKHFRNHVPVYPFKKKK